MKFLRKSSSITAIFLGIWLFTTLSYSMQAECSCCSQKEYQRRCGEKRHGEPLSLNHKNHQEENHHHQKNNHYHSEDNYHHQGKNQCRQEGNRCSCIKCGHSDTKEALFSKIYFTGLEKKQVLTLGQDILEKKILLPKEDILAYLGNKSTSKFHPLFLLKASFLL